MTTVTIPVTSDFIGFTIWMFIMDGIVLTTHGYVQGLAMMTAFIFGACATGNFIRTLYRSALMHKRGECQCHR